MDVFSTIIGFVGALRLQYFHYWILSSFIIIIIGQFSIVNFCYIMEVLFIIIIKQKLTTKYFSLKTCFLEE